MNYRTPYVVTPEGRLLSPASCWVVWLAASETNNWRSAVQSPNRTLGQTVERFGGQDLKVANYVLEPRISEEVRDESATARPNVAYDLYLEGISELELSVLQQTLEDRWTSGNFADGRDGEAGQACAALLGRLTQWVDRVGRPDAGAAEV